MKLLLQWIALAVLLFSISSCGLPGMLGRTVSNTTKKLGSAVNTAAAAAY